MPNYQKILDTIADQASKSSKRGAVASYIPELGSVDIKHFGIYLKTVEGKEFSAADSTQLFSIQSISKVIALAQAMALTGERIWERVGVEPSGNPFNHLSLLEVEKGIPRNPLINSGAIVVADILLSELKDPKNEFLHYVRGLTGDQSIDFNENVAKSEKQTGFKNFAAANLLKSFGNLNNSVDDVLDFYFHQCSIEMSCKQLTETFFFLAKQDSCMREHANLTKKQVKRINAIMLTCGFYDEAGEFAFEVGLPGKSGVGGGIVALLPGQFVITVWSPGLNKKGNSKLGMLALESFTRASEISIF